MSDWNEFFWNALELTDPKYPDATVRYWPESFRDSLTAMKILIEAEPAEYVECPGCVHMHVERVIALPGPDGENRFFIPCPEQLRVELTPADRKRWTIDADAVADSLGSTLGLRGRRKCLVASRLWRLGRTTWRGQSRDALFARGLAGRQRRRIARHISRATRPLVFVGGRPPSPGIWPGRIPPVIALSHVATVCDNHLELDRDAIFAAIREADANTETAQTVAISLEQLRESVLQELRADQRTVLTDDIFVAAYNSEGSYRKAARRLSQELGRAVSKEQVQRALGRRGLLPAAPQKEGSTRSNRVLSQSCDSFQNSSNSSNR